MREGTAEILGAVASSLLDGVLEGVYLKNPGAMAGKFPYVEIVPWLPPVDDLLVGAISGLAYLVGRASKRPAAKAFGKGMLYYGAPMLLKTSTARWIALS